MNAICVYCGSNAGARPEYAAAARHVGEILAGEGIRVVYGGGRVGLMGIVADAAIAAGGEVIGIIPRSLDRREVAHRGVSELVVVESMHERKSLMNEYADGFIALPGGYGTFEELCEILTWSQLGIHRKPVGLLDVAGYYRPLLTFLDHAVTERFLHPDHRGLLLSHTDPVELLALMRTFESPTTQKWLDPGQK
ncbi:MAG: TIGR00730 family Rossman fold protein [Thermomicrobiales bacterium]|nr:TIGR00730 family Rossman fold protein [Thermomicrobiales bacterium]